MSKKKHEIDKLDDKGPYAVPHPYDPALKLTNDLEIFERLTRDKHRDGVVFRPPEDTRLRMAEKVREIFEHIVTERYGKNRDTPVKIHSIVNTFKGEARTRDIPRELVPLNGDLSAMFESYARTTSPSFLLLATEDTRFLGQAAEAEGGNKSNILMAQWNVAGDGHLHHGNEKILRDGDWGYFRSGAHLPLHSWGRKNSTFTIALISVAEPKLPEPKVWR